MGLKEFFQRLPKDGWRIEDGGRIRRGGKLGSDACECPLTATSPCGGGTDFYCLAGRRLGLNGRTTFAIAYAADGPNGGMYRWTPTRGRIRRLLLSHCNLSEPASEGRGT